MNIKFTAKKLEVPSEVKEYAKEKFTKLEKFSHHIQNIDIVMRGEERLICCEALVRIDNREAVIIEVSGETMQGAIDLAVAKCERQLKREKERHSERRRQGAGNKTSEQVE